MHCEWLTQIQKKTAGRRLQRTDRIIGCSRFLTDTICQKFPERSGSCSTIYNGVDIERFSPSRKRPPDATIKEPNILFIGRLSPEKGVHILLEAFQTVLENYPASRLEIVGPMEAIPREFIMKGAVDQKLIEIGRLYTEAYVTQIRKKLPSRVAARITFTGRRRYTNLRNH